MTAPHGGLLSGMGSDGPELQSPALDTDLPGSCCVLVLQLRRLQSLKEEALFSLFSLKWVRVLQIGKYSFRHRGNRCY